MYTLAGCSMSLSGMSGTNPEPAWKGDHYDIDVVAKKLVDKIIHLNLDPIPGGPTISIDAVLSKLGKAKTFIESAIKTSALKYVRKEEANMGIQDTADFGMKMANDIMKVMTTDLPVFSPTQHVEEKYDDEGNMISEAKDVTASDADWYALVWDTGSDEGTMVTNGIRDTLSTEITDIINTILEETGVVNPGDKSIGPDSDGGKYGPPETISVPNYNAPELTSLKTPQEKVDEFVFLIMVKPASSNVDPSVSKLTGTEATLFARGAAVWGERVKQAVVDYATSVGATSQYALDRVDEMVATMTELFTQGFTPVTFTQAEAELAFPKAFAFRYPVTAKNKAAGGSALIPLAIAGVALLLIMRK